MKPPTPPIAVSLLLAALCAVQGQETNTPALETPPPDADADADAMARKLANPVGSLYSVPIETTFDYGAENGEATFIRIQPVIPVTLSEKWNLINRTIIPLIDAPGTPVGTPGNPEPQFGPRTFGLGDISHSMFLSPSAAGKVIWGAGPMLTFPTATSDQLGSEKWSAGPTVVLLMQPKPWTIGLLGGNLWSYAGASDRGDINQMFLQYFINYGFKGGWYLTTSPMMTANWNATSDNRWTIPLGGGVGKVFKIGKQNMRAQLQAFGYVEKPTGGPEWAIQFTVQFVFPRK